MIVYRVETEDGNEHVTGSAGQALNAIGAHLKKGGQIKSVKVEGMSEGVYNSLPATNASAEFFKMN
jgi:hypothetical protein